MTDILWVELPHESAKDREKLDKFFKEQFKDDLDLKVIITYGNVKLHFFGRPIFVYPYWLLKLKLWLKK